MAVNWNGLDDIHIVKCKVCEMEFVCEDNVTICDVCHESMWVNEDDI